MPYQKLLSPWTDRAGRLSFLKTGTFVLVCVPALLVAIALWRNELGPLPYKEALHQIGDWTVRFLVATLALTPLQRILMWPRLALIRRMLGVTAFAYALTHLTLYIVNEKFDLVFVASEIVKRIYLTIGFTALIGLSLLAATSTDAALRRLGRNWKRLHMIVYGIAVLALLHYFMQSKIDVSQATLWSGLFLLLMIYRVAVKLRFTLTPTTLALCAVAGGTPHRARRIRLVRACDRRRSLPRAQGQPGLLLWAAPGLDRVCCRACGRTYPLDQAGLWLCQHPAESRPQRGDALIALEFALQCKHRLRFQDHAVIEDLEMVRGEG